MNLKLVRISFSGLQSEDRTIDLRAPVLAVLGRNGAGKTALVRAIHLTATGRAPGAPSGRGHDPVMALARGRSITIRSWWEDQDAQTYTLVRAWKRDDEGSTKATCTGSLANLLAGGAKDKTAAVEAALGRCAEAWAPSSLVEGPTATPTPLRKRLLALVGGGDPAQWVPEWLDEGVRRPLEGETADEWIARAIRLAKDDCASVAEEIAAADRWIAETAGDPPVTSPDAIKERLAALRAEERSAEPRTRAEARVAELTADLARLRERLVVDAPAVADAAKGLDAAIAIRGEAAKAADTARRIERLAYLIRSVGELAAACPAGEPPTDDEDTASAILAHTAARGLKAARAARDAAAAEVAAAERLAKHTGKCLECGADLAAQGTGALAAARAALTATEAELWSADKADETAAKARALHTGRARRVEYQAEIAGYRTELAGLEAALPAVSLADAERRVAAARAALSTAERQAQLRDDIEARGVDLEEAIAVRDVAPPSKRPLAEVRAEIEEADEELLRVGKHEERRQRRQTAIDEAAQARDAAVIAGDHLKELERIQRDLLDHVKGTLETRVSAATGTPVTVELTDARGGETCVLYAGGVAAATKSKGERIEFLSSMVAALARGSGAAWAPLIVDEVESVSRDRRAAFVRACAAAVASGAVSQAVICGCPDTWDMIDREHVQVIDLDSAPGPTGGDETAEVRDAVA